MTVKVKPGRDARAVLLDRGSGQPRVATTAVAVAAAGMGVQPDLY